MRPATYDHMLAPLNVLTLPDFLPLGLLLFLFVVAAGHEKRTNHELIGMTVGRYAVCDNHIITELLVKILSSLIS